MRFPGIYPVLAGWLGGMRVIKQRQNAEVPFHKTSMFDGAAWD